MSWRIRVVVYFSGMRYVLGLLLLSTLALAGCERDDGFETGLGRFVLEDYAAVVLDDSAGVVTTYNLSLSAADVTLELFPDSFSQAGILTVGLTGERGGAIVMDSTFTLAVAAAGSSPTASVLSRGVQIPVPTFIDFTYPRDVERWNANQSFGSDRYSNSYRFSGTSLQYVDSVTVERSIRIEQSYRR